MKKLISILLVLSLMASLVVTSGAASNGEVSFAVASDLHYNVPEEELSWYSEDPIFGYANRRAAMENESGFIIDDDSKHVQSLLLECFVDKDNPRTEFTIIIKE